jgi:hypothetical protein
MATQIWYDEELPFLVRLCDCIAELKVCPAEEKAFFMSAYAELATEYTTFGTILSHIREHLKVFIEPDSDENDLISKLWYLSHLCLGMVARRTSDTFIIGVKCPKFMAHREDLNHAMNRMQIPEVAQYEVVPTAKTYDDLQTEEARELYKALEDACKYANVDPNAAFEMAMYIQYVLDNEETITNPLTVSGRLKWMFPERPACIAFDSESDFESDSDSDG